MINKRLECQDLKKTIVYYYYINYNKDGISDFIK
jgi:hypothetical protein